MSAYRWAGAPPLRQMIFPLCIFITELYLLKLQLQHLSEHRISVCLRGNEGGAHTVEKMIVARQARR